MLDRPDIVIILTDDQRFDTLWAMPNVQSLLVDHVVTKRWSSVRMRTMSGRSLVSCVIRTAGRVCGRPAECTSDTPMVPTSTGVIALNHTSRANRALLSRGTRRAARRPDPDGSARPGLRARLPNICCPPPVPPPSMGREVPNRLGVFALDSTHL